MLGRATHPEIESANVNSTFLWPTPSISRRQPLAVGTGMLVQHKDPQIAMWLWATCKECTREFKFKLLPSMQFDSPHDLFCRHACLERHRDTNDKSSTLREKCFALVAPTALEHTRLPKARLSTPTTSNLYPCERVHVSQPQHVVGSMVVVGRSDCLLGETSETPRLAVVVAPSYFSQSGRVLVRVRWLHKRTRAESWAAVTNAIQQCCMLSDVAGHDPKACKIRVSMFETRAGFVSSIPERLISTQLCSSGVSLLQRQDECQPGGTQASDSFHPHTDVDDDNGAYNSFRRHLKPVEKSGPGSRATKLRGPFLGIFPGTLPVKKTKQKSSAIVYDRIQKDMDRQDRSWAVGKRMPPLLSLVDTPFSEIATIARSGHAPYQLAHGSFFSRLYTHKVDGSEDSTHKHVWNVLPQNLRAHGARIVRTLREVSGSTLPKSMETTDFRTGSDSCGVQPVYQVLTESSQDTGNDMPEDTVRVSKTRSGSQTSFDLGTIPAQALNVDAAALGIPSLDAQALNSDVTFGEVRKRKNTEVEICTRTRRKRSSTEEIAP